MKRIGLIVNPIAGMGGRVGLKGTDGEEILRKAKELGAVEEAPGKAMRALKKLLPLKDTLLILTGSGKMGEQECREVGLSYEVIHQVADASSQQDTLALAKKLEQEDVEMIVFVGGDGTARDLFTAVGSKVIAVGIPAGVKIHSPVYGNTPEQAGELVRDYLAGEYLPLREEEVIDLDEEAFRQDQVSTRLFGVLRVPYSPQYLQCKKSMTPQSDEVAQEAIALDVIDEMEDDVFYIIGSGTTPRFIMKELGLDNTILGVDIIKNKKLIRKDCNEQEILETIGNEKAKLVITPMGGQGYLLGRGNQQISADVLKRIDKKDIIIIATSSKLEALGNRPLLIYTMDDETDKRLAGYHLVKVGYDREMVMKVENQ